MVIAILVMAAPIQVSTLGELRQALAAAKPGTEIRIASGIYAGGFQFADLHGAPGRPIRLRAAFKSRRLRRLLKAATESSFPM